MAIHSLAIHISSSLAHILEPFQRLIGKTTNS